MMSSSIPCGRPARACPPRTRGRAWRAAALLSAALALVACSDATAPLPQAGVPDALEFSMGGYFGGGTSVSLRGDTLVFFRTPWEWRPDMTIDTVRVVPTADAWRAFWSATSRAGVGRWRARYVAEEIADGTGWNLRIVAGGRRIESFGSNAYPDRLGLQRRGEMTEDFRGFVAALGALVGQPVM